MKVRFLVDAMLPPKFVKWLKDQGFEARRSTSLGINGTSDAKIWQTACQTNEIVISRDKDFIELARHTPFGKVVLFRHGNTNFSQLVLDFEVSKLAILAFAESEQNLLSLP